MPADPVRLDPGNHDDPGAGRCLMEHVSVLAGEPFGAWPRCTHPAVAALAMLANDRCSPRGRAVLLDRAEALRRADSDDPALTWRLVALAAHAVQARRPGDPVASRRLARARRARGLWGVVLPRGVARRLPRWVVVGCGLAALDELVAALHALLIVSGPPSSPERDAALVALLDRALDQVLHEDTPDPALTAASTGRRGSPAALRAATREELCA